MRQYFLVAIFTMLSLSVAAQGTHERSEYSIKTTKTLTAEGDVQSVTLSVCLDEQVVKEYTYELTPPVYANQAEIIGTITEEDINFDGYPDVDVYLGYMGGFSNNTYHEALLWDQSQHFFVEPEGYSGIGEPQAVSGQKYIYTVLSDGPDHRVTSFYRWKGNILEQIRTHTWAIESDEYVDFDGLMLLPAYRFDAKLDGKIPVNIVFQKTDDDDIVAGYIYYPKAKHPAPILIAGYVARSSGRTADGAVFVPSALPQV